MAFSTPRRATPHILVTADALTVIGGIQTRDVQFVRLREQDPPVAGTAGLVTVDDENADIMDLGKNECAASQMAK